jgi:hypothetical protein
MRVTSQPEGPVAVAAAVCLAWTSTAASPTWRLNSMPGTTQHEAPTAVVSAARMVCGHAGRFEVVSILSSCSRVLSWTMFMFVPSSPWRCLLCNKRYLFLAHKY